MTTADYALNLWIGFVCDWSGSPIAGVLIGMSNPDQAMSGCAGNSEFPVDAILVF